MVLASEPKPLPTELVDQLGQAQLLPLQGCKVGALCPNTTDGNKNNETGIKIPRTSFKQARKPKNSNLMASPTKLIL